MKRISLSRKERGERKREGRSLKVQNSALPKRPKSEKKLTCIINRKVQFSAVGAQNAQKMKTKSEERKLYHQQEVQESSLSKIVNVKKFNLIELFYC